MRRAMAGEPHFQPGDDLDTIRENAAFTNPDCAQCEPNKDEAFGFGGELFDDEGNSVAFDGFDTREEMRAWLTDVIGLPEHEIMTLD